MQSSVNNDLHYGNSLRVRTQTEQNVLLLSFAQKTLSKQAKNTFYHCRLSSIYLAPFDYSSVNWDLVNTFPENLARVGGMEVLRNEMLVTKVRLYLSQSAFSKEAHDALHSQVNGSSVEFPHSFVSYPIFSVPGDSKSEIVASVGSGFAWDFALRNLLPEGVDGIIVEIENSCNQSYSYQISGPEALFIGEGALHETKFNNRKVSRSLSIHNHPNFTTTPGHCYYSMVSLRKFI
jgi:hypothetical protein